jgi:outer membrane cobalamin receptor
LSEHSSNFITMPHRKPPFSRLKPLTASLLVLPLTAFAQQTDQLPTVLITADRQDLPRDQVASPTRLLDRETLEALPVKDVTEALATLPNVNIRRSGGPDGEPSLGMYGISAQPRSSSSTTLAINGVPLNNGMFPESSLNILPLGLIERIEVIQGPASSAYGNNATLGVINLHTRERHELGGEVSSSIARWNTQSASANIGGGFDGGGNWLIGAELRRTDGHLQPKNSSDFSNSELDNLALFGNKAVGSLLLKAGYISYAWDRNNPNYLVSAGTPAIDNPRGTPTARTEDGRRQHFHLGGEWHINDEFRAELTYSWNGFSEKTSRNANYGTPSGNNNPTHQKTTSNGLIGKVDWETSRNLMTIGFERQLGELTDVISDTVTKGATTGYFILNRFLAFNRQLSISGGYRIDQFSFYDETSRTPKLGAVWKPEGMNWLLRANISRAFSAPSFNQLFGALGNTQLLASTLDLKEVGGEFQALENLNIGFTYFDVKRLKPIFPRPRNQNPICTPGPGNCFVNVGDQLNYSGVTLDFSHTITSGWNWGGSLTLLDPRNNTFATSGRVLKLNTAYRQGPWRVGANLRHEAQRYFQDNQSSPFPDFTVVDVGVTYRFSNRFELVANIENLTNKTYATTQIVSTNFSIPALPINRPGRYMTIKATYSF